MDKHKTVAEHLEEARRRILASLAVVLVLTCFTFSYTSQILSFLQAPAGGMVDKLVFFSPTEAFMVYFKLAFFSALILSVPFLLFQVWAFVVPALDDKMRSRGALFLLCSVGAFATGALFGYVILLPVAIQFLLGFAAGTLLPLISASEYISFIIGLVFGCGLVFEMPVLSFIFSRMGILNGEMLSKNWRYALVIIMITAAVVTPTPDAFNMMVLAVPMVALYQISIWVSAWANPRQALKQTV